MEALKFCAPFLARGKSRVNSSKVTLGRGVRKAIPAVTFLLTMCIVTGVRTRRVPPSDMADSRL